METQFIAAVFPRVVCGEAEKWSVVHDNDVDDGDDVDDDYDNGVDGGDVGDEDSSLATICTFH